MEEKLWYTSKTLWVNVVAIVGMILQGQFGYTLSPELQVSILALINIVLRAVTHEPVVWGRKK